MSTFNSIAKKSVFLVDNQTGQREKVTVAIGAPYRPAQSPAMKDYAACLIQFYEEIGDSGFEVFGLDEFEALDNAIQNVKALLQGMASSGVLEDADGKPYSEQKSAYGELQARFNERVAKILRDRKPGAN